MSKLTFVCGPTREKWDGDTHLHRGIGGAEESVIYLAPQLSKLGWNVTVYNDCETEKRIDGVNWKPYEKWNPSERCEVAVVWRRPDNVKLVTGAKKIFLDLHDIGIPTWLCRVKCDGVFVKSNYHKDLYYGIPRTRFIVLGYGVDFQAEGAKDGLLMINTSAPERSLSSLLTLFLEVKKEIPEAKLNWAYGWNAFDHAYRDDVQMLRWKGSILERMTEYGVENLGRVTHKDVRALYQRATVYAYPTHFPEAGCVSIVKAQAAGVVPVTTTAGGLDELVVAGHKIPVATHRYRKDYGLQGEEARARWVDAVVATLKNPEPMTYVALSWEDVAQLWHVELTK